MKYMRFAISLIAACASFHWARAQNSTENTVSEAPAAAASTALATSAREEQTRARIVQEKAKIASDYEAAKVDCYQRFQVNSCLADARTVRISRSKDLKREEVLLNDAERKRRAAEQLERTQEKALARGGDAVSAPLGEPTVTQTIPKQTSSTQASLSQASLSQAQRQQRAEQKAVAQQSATQAAKARQTEVASKQANAASKAAARKAKLAQAVDNKARYEANLKAAEAHRANAMTRQLAAKKNVAPLPVPKN